MKNPPQKDTLNISTLAEQLHNWYLEAIRDLNPAYFNSKAAVEWKDLHKGQKHIDMYIAKKVADTIKEATQNLANEIKSYDWQLEDSINANDVVADTVDQALEDCRKALPSIHANEIKGMDCLACGHPTLMIFDGYITCTLADCPDPDFASVVTDLASNHRNATTGVVRPPKSADIRNNLQKGLK